MCSNEVLIREDGFYNIFTECTQCKQTGILIESTEMCQMVCKISIMHP